MRGALLRSGKIEDYDALGEAGTAVHRVAQQLREAVRRQGPDLVKHLAIPQINQAGDSIDWYAPKSGSIIPWSSSTEDERIPARAQMESWKVGLQVLSTRLLNANADKPDSDTALFAKLLGRVSYFPDESYVYLVDGTPVVTFWGFDHAGADRMRNPLLCLYSPPPAPTPVSPLPTPAPVVAPAIAAATQPWWKRWWWLLLLLPLLLLLLFGLRGCTGGLPVSGWPSWLPFTASAPDLGIPQVPAANVVPPQGSGRTLSGTAPTPGAGLNVADKSVLVPSVDTTTPAVPATEPADSDPASAAPEPTAKEPSTEAAPAEPSTPPSLDANATSSTLPQVDPNAPLPAPAQPDALSLPPNLANGPADFLNGKWRAGAGIQDAQTGKPLRLEYQFKNGKGQVTVTRGNATCQGPVSAAMEGGALQITPNGQAQCSDGGQYELPQIQCKPGATTSADCAGHYRDMRFPLSMRQAGG